MLHRRGWLSETPESFREAVLSQCRVLTLAARSVVYRAGDPPGGLYGVAEGAIAVEIAPVDREPYIGHVARAGAWFGEGTTLIRRPRMVGVQTVRESVLYHLPLDRWDALAAEDPQAWRWFAHLVSRNEMIAIGVAEDLMIRDSAARVAAMLLRLGGYVETPPWPEPQVELDIGQEDLAQMTNLSRSSVSRILDEFTEAGLVLRAYRCIQVRNVEGLWQRRAG